jgi:DNA-directed RNA polymerase specialized sigma24 family protein
MAVDPEGAFGAFFEDAEPRLRRALIAAYGPDRGREATAEALAYAWQHWERVRAMANPVGYLFRVGQSKGRRRLRPAFPPVDSTTLPWVEPGLPGALERLSRRERIVVVLVEAYSWTQREVAEVTGLSASSVQTYLARALAKLRADLGVRSEQ